MRATVPVVAPAVMVGHSEFGHKNVVFPHLPVMVTSGSSALLSYGAMAARRGETGEIHFPAKRRSLRPEAVLEAQSRVGAEAEGTWWGAYNAVSEYTDHYVTRSVTDDSLLKSIWFGSKERLKKAAFPLAAEAVARN